MAANIFHLSHCSDFEATQLVQPLERSTRIIYQGVHKTVGTIITAAIAGSTRNGLVEIQQGLRGQLYVQFILCGNSITIRNSTSGSFTPAITTNSWILLSHDFTAIVNAINISPIPSCGQI
jgi:hypothetical protein